ncbi:MAG: hypothetical protein AAGM22_08705 [Acidobacteriota bacterium]
MKTLLLLAPVPALVGSLWLMQTVDVGAGVLGQQVVFSLVSLLVCGPMLRKPRGSLSEVSQQRLALVFLALLVIPSLGSGEAPRRWLELAGFRFYVASALLPAALFLLARLHRGQPSSARRAAVLSVAMAAALALQPDASQVTALSVAAGFALLVGHAPKKIKAAALAGLAVCTGWAWSRPDPLEPVPHVEGVLDLAWGFGPWAFIAAVLALALPILVLVRAGVDSRRSEFASVALYYLAICLLAGFTQLTPVVWLGFGAGPILGYFAVVYMLSA